MVNLPALWLCLLAAKNACDQRSDVDPVSGSMYLADLPDNYNIEEVPETISTSQWWRENWDNVLIYSVFAILMVACITATVVSFLLFLF